MEAEGSRPGGRHVGLIGGIGPAATAVYHGTVARLCAAAGHRLEMTIAHADLATLAANLRANRADAQVAEYRCHAAQLRAAGAAFVAVTSMGGHFCIDGFAAVSPLPVLDGLAALRDRLRSGGLARVGVLGTRAAMETALFGRAGVPVLAPEGDAMDAVDADYGALAEAGAADAGQRARLRAAGAALMARGAEAVVLGGTDLSLAVDGADPGYPVIDAARVHAAAIARAAMAG